MGSAFYNLFCIFPFALRNLIKFVLSIFNGSTLRAFGSLFLWSSGGMVVYKPNYNLNVSTAIAQLLQCKERLYRA